MPITQCCVQNACAHFNYALKHILHNRKKKKNAMNPQIPALYHSLFDKGSIPLRVYCLELIFRTGLGPLKKRLFIKTA